LGGAQGHIHSIMRLCDDPRRFWGVIYPSILGLILGLKDQIQINQNYFLIPSFQGMRLSK
jgi:hypothetical protein